MIVLGGFLGGAVWGAGLARRRGGNRLDIAQYGAVYGIGCALVGVFITIAIARMTRG